MSEDSEVPVDIEKTLDEVRKPSQFISTKKPGSRYQTRDFRTGPKGKIRFREDHHDRDDIHRYKDETKIYNGLDVKEKIQRKDAKLAIEEGWEDYKQYTLEDFYNQFEYTNEDEQDYPNELEPYIDEEAELGYKPFYPQEELQEINTLIFSADPTIKAEGKARLEEFKKQLLEQQVGIGRLIYDLASIVRYYPEVSEGSLKSCVTEQAQKLQLGYGQLEYFESGIRGYIAKHNAVEAYAALYQDPNILFKKVFGVSPQGEVEVVKGAMTLLFRCKNEDDYATAYWGGLATLTQNHKDQAQRSGGAALSASELPDLKDAITIENTKPTTTVEWQESLQAHEDQHQFNKLFKPLETQLVEYTILHKAIQQGADDPQTLVQNVAHEYIRHKRRTIGIDSRARDELLAYFKDGTGPSEIARILQTNPLYEYKSMPYYKTSIDAIHAELIDQVRTYVVNSVSTHRGLHGKRAISPELVDSLIDTVFGDEYDQDITRWSK